VREFKRSGRTLEDFRIRLERVAAGINLQFPQALKLAEVRAIAKSVSRWTWRQFSDEKFRDRQKVLSARANAKRWANHVADSSTKPWEALGISRPTYYRRKARGPIAAAQLASAQSIPRSSPTSDRLSSVTPQRSEPVRQSASH
jgi:hypothetical protein